MHIQSRSLVSASPADLEKFLTVLADPGQPGGPINIEGVTGSGLEFDGEFVFCVEDGREDDAQRALEAAGYKPVFVTVWHRVLGSNSAGELLAAIHDASIEARNQHAVIRDVLIGQESGSGDHFVQVAFQEIRT